MLMTEVILESSRPLPSWLHF